MRRVSAAWESPESPRCRLARGERRRLPPLQSYSRAAPTTISHCSSPDVASSCINRFAFNFSYNKGPFDLRGYLALTGMPGLPEDWTSPLCSDLIDAWHGRRTMWRGLELGVMCPGSLSSRSGVFSWRATGRCPMSGSPRLGASASCRLAASGRSCASAAACACAAPCAAGGTAGASCFGVAAWAVATLGSPAGVPSSAALRSCAIRLSSVEGTLSPACRRGLGEASVAATSESL